MSMPINNSNEPVQIRNKSSRKSRAALQTLSAPQLPAEVTAALAARPSTPKLQDLNTSETSILKQLLQKAQDAQIDVSTFVGHALKNRGLDPQKFGISLQDLKTIVVKPVDAPASAPAPKE